MDPLAYALAGIIFGISAGLTPGPLLTLAITNTIKHGKFEGIKVAIAPFITDIPITLAVIFLFSFIPNTNLLLGIVSISGGLFIAYLGYESIRTKPIELNGKNNPRSLREGIIVNFLNPHPYVFFFTVGGPLIINGLKSGILGPALFLFGLLGSISGSIIVIVLLVSKSKEFLKSKTYIYVMKIFGIALLIYAFIFLQNGIQLLGI